MDEKGKATELNEQGSVTSRDGRSLAVRRLTRADGPALQRFNAGLSPESRRLFLPHRYDDETVRKSLGRSADGEDLALGLWDGERLVGYFFLWYFRRRVPLLGIGLADEYQGRGLGRPLMDILIREAERNGNEGIELTTMQDNERAFALYRKAGFRYLRDVENVAGDGRIAIERAMFHEIKPGAAPMQEPHRPPV